MKKLLLVVVLMMTTFSSPDTEPPRRYALIVAIADYPEPVKDLPAVRKDATAVTDLLEKGFGISDVVLLQDGQATKDRVATAIVQHLGQAKERDKVIFYFSGHGTRVPDSAQGRADDEQDGFDEALILHDGLLLDDFFGDLISRLAARDILIIVDSCHSGTITRVIGDEEPQPKFTPFEDLETWEGLLETPKAAAADPPTEHRRISLREPGDHLLLAASEDDQLSWTRRGQDGSVFTYYLIRALLSEPDSTSFAEIMNTARRRTRNYTIDTDEQVPQLVGNRGGDAVSSFLGPKSQGVR